MDYGAGDELTLPDFNPDDLADTVNAGAGGQGDAEGADGDTQPQPIQRAPYIEEEPLDLSAISNAHVLLVKVPREVLARWKLEMQQGPVEIVDPRDGSVRYEPRRLGKLRMYNPTVQGSDERDWELHLPPTTLDPLPTRPPRPIASSSTSRAVPPPTTIPQLTTAPLDLTDPTVSSNLARFDLQGLPNSSFNPEFNGEEAGQVWMDKRGNLARRRYLMIERVRKIRGHGKSTEPGMPKILGNAIKVATLAAKRDQGGREYKREVLSRYEAYEEAKPKMRRLDREGYTQRELNQLMSGKAPARTDPLNKGKSSGSTSAPVPARPTRIIKDKAVRLDKAVVLDLLFECFAEYQYWSTTNLTERLGQPRQHLVGILQGIASQDKTGPYKDLWHLKDNFLDQQGDADNVTEAPDTLGVLQSAVQAVERAVQSGEADEVDLLDDANMSDVEEDDDDDDDEDMVEVE